MTRPLAPGTFARALKSRRASDRRRRWLFWGIFAAVAAVAGLLVYLLAFSPLLATRSVEVEGTGLLTAGQVEQAAAVPLGVPLLRQDTEAIAGRVRGLPPVESVSIGRRPPGTVVVTVKERTLAYQLIGEGEVHWVDPSGVVYNSSPEASDGVIQVEATRPDERLRRDIATVVTHLPEAVKRDVRSFEADAVDRISFTLSGKREVVWGSAEDSELKAEVLAALLSVDASVYDVSAPRNPITKK